MLADLRELPELGVVRTCRLSRRLPAPDEPEEVTDGVAGDGSVAVAAHPSSGTGGSGAEQAAVGVAGRGKIRRASIR